MSSRRAIHVALIAATLSPWPAVARADSSILVGFQIGAAATRGPVDDTAMHFRLGTGLDWLNDRGPAASFRVDTTHRLDATASALGGWWGPGLFTNRGLPLGFGVGPSLGLDRRLDARWGGRAHIVWGLWYSRAVIEVDLTVRRRVTGSARPAEDGWGWMAAVALRVVPWGPLSL